MTPATAKTLFPTPRSRTTALRRFVSIAAIPTSTCATASPGISFINSPIERQMQRLNNGWGLNGIVTVQSGQPFQLNYNFQDDYDGSGEFFGRPDVVGPSPLHQRSAQLSRPDFLCGAMHVSGWRRRRNCGHLHSRIHGISEMKDATL